MSEVRGNIFDIQRFSLDDGAGIRTVVFMKGCNLHCPWCHNPESVGEKRTLMRNSKCTSCGRCESACPKGCIRKEGVLFIDKNVCDMCGKCVEACMNGALSICGQSVTVDDVMETVMRDKDYYEASGGGITLSGGEPSQQLMFSIEILKACKNASIDSNIETNGTMSDEARCELGNLLDGAMVDLKHWDSAVYEKTLGAGNESALKTIEEWSEKMPVEVRVPVIPGFNDTAGDIEKIYRLAEERGASKVTLLPYHTFGIAKYKSMGMEYEFGALEPMSAWRLQELADFEGNDILTIRGI